MQSREMQSDKEECQIINKQTCISLIPLGKFFFFFLVSFSPTSYLKRGLLFCLGNCLRDDVYERNACF